MCTSGSENDFQIPEWERRACPPSSSSDSFSPESRRLYAPPPSVALSPPPSVFRARMRGREGARVLHRFSAPTTDGRTEDSSSAKVKAVSAVIRIRVCACGRVGYTPGLNQNLVTAKNCELLANTACVRGGESVFNHISSTSSTQFFRLEVLSSELRE